MFTGLSILFWGGSATAFKIALKTVTPFLLLLYSATISMLVLAVVITIQGHWRQLRVLSAGQWGGLSALGLLNPFLYYTVLFQAYDLLPGQIAMSINYLWPVMLALLSVPVLKHRLTVKNIIAILISFTGAVIIAVGGNPMGKGEISITGLLLALFSTLIWALYWLFNARIKAPVAVKLFIGFISGTFFIYIYVLFVKHQIVFLDTVPWSAVVYIGVLEMGITFFLWLKALEWSPNAAQTGNLIYLTPFLSLLILSRVWKEPILPATVAGLIIIIVGIILQQSGKKV